MARMIEVRDLHFGYQPDRPTLRGIDLDIEEGSYVGIVGSNGSGKSTFTKHLNALLLPTKGTVLVDGVSTVDDPDAARTLVGMVLQNPENQIVGTVVEDDVAFGPENLRLEHDELVRRVDEALDRVGLGVCRGRGSETLSGGQKQRLAIAGILAMRPRYVVVDEPTSMLDPVGRREVIDCLEDLHQAGVTVIHVTHLLEELLGADRILAMEHGEVTFDGTPRDLFLDRKRMDRLRLELPAPAALALALEKQKGVSRGVPWELGALLEHLGVDAEGSDDVEPGPAPRVASSGDDAVLRGEGLAMEYSVGSPLQVTALQGVDLALHPGELLGLVGSTGSGKSTLIQLLAGLLHPTSGRVHYPDDVDPRRLYQSVGVVFQQPEDQLFEPTVFEDVAYGPRQLGVPEAELGELVCRALDLLGLPTGDILERSPFDLSGGEKRRVAIAGILSMRPKVLIFDEPTAGLDAHARRLLQGTLQNLHESGEATVLVVSHDMDLLAEMAEMATRIVLLHEGTVLADAPPADVFSRPHEIRRAGLEAPYPAAVLSRLAEDGWDVTPGLVGAADAAKAIAGAWRGRRKDGGR
jgi:energy-coupling factor transport system ATP-binding protein